MGCPMLHASVSQLNVLNELMEIGPGRLTQGKGGDKNKNKKKNRSSISPQFLFMTEPEAVRTAGWHPAHMTVRGQELQVEGSLLYIYLKP